MKRKKKNKEPKLKVIYEYKPSKDAEFRLAQAFKMLLEDDPKTSNRPKWWPFPKAWPQRIVSCQKSKFRLNYNYKSEGFKTLLNN